MNRAEILKNLKDDSKYYGKFGKQYLSNSDIFNLLKNPTQFRVPQEITKPMLEGRYFHTKILEPHKLSEFNVVDASSRSTKIFKDFVAEKGLNHYDVLLTKEQEHLD